MQINATGHLTLSLRETNQKENDPSSSYSKRSHNYFFPLKKKIAKTQKDLETSTDKAKLPHK
jgi:hypothetical protein